MKHNLLHHNPLFLFAGLASLAILPACNELEEGFYVSNRSELSLIVTPENANGSDKSLSEILAVGGRDIIHVETRAPWRVELMTDNRNETDQDWTLRIEEIVNDERGSYFAYNSTTNLGGQRQWDNAFKVYIEDYEGAELMPTFISVRQGISALVPTPTGFPLFSPAGQADNVINVEANGSWNVICDAEQTTARPEGWLELNRPDNMTGDGILKFNVLANRGTSERSTTLRFTDTSGKVVAEIDIRQAQADAVFDVGPNSSFEYTIPAVGGDLKLYVLSDSKWRVDCAQGGESGWLSFSNLTLGASQNASTGSGTEVRIKAAPAVDLYEREARLVFHRTEDGVNDIVVTVRQTGTPNVEETFAISRPWIDGDYTQEYVTLRANYVSAAEVSERGIAVRKKGDTDYTLVKNLSGISNGSATQGRIAVCLTEANGYKGGIDFEVRAYLKIGDRTEYGPIYEFTSPGAIPGSGDNTPPNLKRQSK